MKASDVEVGMPFRFKGGETIFISRGSGWYCSPKGYDGGPWVESDRDQEVERAPTNLHSRSFIGFNLDELHRLSNEMPAAIPGKWTEGDLALIDYEFTRREDFPEEARCCST